MLEILKSHRIAAPKDVVLSSPDLHYISSQVILPRITSTIRTVTYDEEWDFRNLKYDELEQLRNIVTGDIINQFTTEVFFTIRIFPKFHVQVNKLSESIVAELDRRREVELGCELKEARVYIEDLKRRATKGKNSKFMRLLGRHHHL